MSTWTALSATVVALAAAACTTAAPTKISDTWKDPTYAAGPLRNIVVFGTAMTGTNRRTVEDTFASRIAKHGVRVTPSYQLFPDELPSRDVARDALQKGGYDGALVATMKGIRQAVAVRSGGPSTFYDYYGGWGESDYLVTDQYVKFETTLWDARGSGKLIWSAVTQTQNPSSAKDFATSLVDKVVPALAEAGLLPPEQPGKPVARVQ